MECLKAPDDDTPSSSMTPDAVHPSAALLHDFAKEGKKCQDQISHTGGVPLLLDLLPSPTEHCSETETSVEAIATLCLIAIGSEIGRWVC